MSCRTLTLIKDDKSTTTWKWLPSHDSRGWESKSPSWELFVSTYTAQPLHHYCEMHAIVWAIGGWKNKTSVILHCEFLIVLFIHPYRCFAAVIINVGNKCPPPQGGKQSCGWRRPHLGGEIKWLSSGVQVVEESKSEQRGVHLTRRRWGNTWYYLS